MILGFTKHVHGANTTSLGKLRSALLSPTHKVLTLITYSDCWTFAIGPWTTFTKKIHLFPTFWPPNHTWVFFATPHWWIVHHLRINKPPLILGGQF
jgi:hypothetical protein